MPSGALGPVAETAPAKQRSLRFTPRDRLRKRFEFRGFTAAIAFIDRMADVAKASRHHPDFCSHYDTVDVVVTTHAEGGVTSADLSLARAIQAVGEAVGGT